MNKKRGHRDVYHFPHHAEERASHMKVSLNGNKRSTGHGKSVAVARYIYGGFDSIGSAFRVTDALFVSTDLIKDYSNMVVLGGLSAEKSCLIINRRLSKADFGGEVIEYIKEKTWLRLFDMFQGGHI